MDKLSKITRLCSICGIKKPISAFLHISGTHGTHYGKVCSDCRSQAKTAPLQNKSEDTETESGSSGLRIGTKERIYAEKEKANKIKNLKELYRIDFNEREALFKEKQQLQELKEKTDKNHQFFIEAKKNQGFLSQKSPAHTKAHEAKKFINAKQERTLEMVKQEDIIRQELHISGWKLPSPFLNPEIAMQFMKWLGTPSPFLTLLNQLHGHKTLQGQLRTVQEKTLPKETFRMKQFADSKTLSNRDRLAKEGKKTHDSLEDYLHRRPGPSRGR